MTATKSTSKPSKPRETRLFTIGFTHSTAEHFFTRLASAGVKRVIDVRLNNVSQLAGFSKKDDLRYFLEKLCGIDYVHETQLAPTEEIKDGLKKQKGAWPDFEKKFLSLLRERKIEETLARDQLQDACLLCSEERPQQCHRRLVAEYLRDRWGGLEIVHL